MNKLDIKLILWLILFSLSFVSMIIFSCLNSKELSLVSFLVMAVSIVRVKWLLFVTMQEDLNETDRWG